MSKTTIKFKCIKCGKYTPCYVVVKAEDCMPPTRCPFNPNADHFCEWKFVTPKAQVKE